MKLHDVFKRLDIDVPLVNAATWDKVGPLVVPDGDASLSTILLTVDLTAAVLAEAIDKQAQLIVAYHPPIFKPLSALRADQATEPMQAVVVNAIRSGIAIYSPHTALDAVSGGVADWLCDGLGDGTRTGIDPCESNASSSVADRASARDDEKCIVSVHVPQDHADDLREALANIGVGKIGNYDGCSFSFDGLGRFSAGEKSNPVVGIRGDVTTVNEVRIEMRCTRRQVADIKKVMSAHHPYEEPAWHLTPLLPTTDRGACNKIKGSGAHAQQPITAYGRVVTLATPVTVNELCARVKTHLDVDYLRVAAPEHIQNGSSMISDIAVCPGAGGSPFDGRQHACYLTGEMRHHDVLSKLAQGSTVILSEHTHTERGYLPIYKKRVHAALGSAMNVHIATTDRDPLRVI